MAGDGSNKSRGKILKRKKGEKAKKPGLMSMKDLYEKVVGSDDDSDTVSASRGQQVTR